MLYIDAPVAQVAVVRHVAVHALFGAVVPYEICGIFRKCRAAHEVAVFSVRNVHAVAAVDEIETRMRRFGNGVQKILELFKKRL